MASFLSKILNLFGGAKSGTPVVLPEKTETYGDFLIRARPLREGSQYRLAGSIEKTQNIAGADTPVKVRTFIRADVFGSEQDAVEATFRKAHQIIDQSGPSLFADEVATRQV